MHNDEAVPVKEHEKDGCASTSVLESTHGPNMSSKLPEGSECTHCVGHVVVVVTLVPSESRNLPPCSVATCP